MNSYLLLLMFKLISPQKQSIVNLKFIKEYSTQNTLSLANMMQNSDKFHKFIGVCKFCLLRVIVGLVGLVPLCHLFSWEFRRSKIFLSWIFCSWNISWYWLHEEEWQKNRNTKIHLKLCILFPIDFNSCQYCLY